MRSSTEVPSFRVNILGSIFLGWLFLAWIFLGWIFSGWVFLGWIFPELIVSQWDHQPRFAVCRRVVFQPPWFWIQLFYSSWNFCSIRIFIFRQPFLGSLAIVYGWFLVCNKFSLLTLTRRSFMVDYRITCISFHSTSKHPLQIPADLIVASNQTFKRGRCIRHTLVIVIGKIPPKSRTENRHKVYQTPPL